MVTETTPVTGKLKSTHSNPSISAPAPITNSQPTRYGGELVSLAINHSASASFFSAGYADVRVNDTYSGGQVRQHGNLSFTRVYQAGHEVPYYQPQTAYEIFTRALFNKDIATGEQSTGEGSNYSSSGPQSSLAHRNEQLAEQPLQFCYALDPGSTCTETQVESLLDGSATVCRYIVKDRNSTRLFPEIVGEEGVEGCAAGVGAGNGSAGNGTLGGGNGTVGGGGPGSSPSPFTGGAEGVSSVMMGSVAMVCGMVVAFALL